MTKKECPGCAMDVDAKSKECPICGYKFQAFSKSIQWIAIFLIILFLLYIIL